jgi:hypothetical protein
MAKKSCQAPKRAKPFTQDQHAKMGKGLATLGGELMEMQDSVGKSYPHSTEPARAVRELIRSYNRVRSALVSRFFGEGHSVDYPVGMKPVKPAEKPDTDDGEEEEDETT